MPVYNIVFVNEKGEPVSTMTQSFDTEGQAHTKARFLVATGTFDKPVADYRLEEKP